MYSLFIEMCKAIVLKSVYNEAGFILKSVQKAQSPPIEGALRKELIVSTSNPHIRIDRFFSERYNNSTIKNLTKGKDR